MQMKDSGIEWIGQIPEDWDIYRIKDILSILTDYTANGSFQGLADNVEYLDYEDFARVIRLTDLRVNMENVGIYVNEDAYNYLAKSSLFGHEILLANVGAYAGLFCEMPVVDYKATLGPNMFMIKTNDLLESHLLYYIGIADCSVEQLIIKSTSSAQPKLNKQDVKTVYLTFPKSKKEQQLIADFLDDKVGKIDDILSDLKNQVEILVKYKKSLITEIVTKGLNPDVPMKDSGIEWIGEIPETWDSEKRIKDVFILGKGLSITKENLEDEGINVISYGQVHSKDNTGTYIKDCLFRFVNEDYLKKNTKCLVNKGDFIFADTSEDLNGCGNCVYIDYSDTIFAGYHTIIFKSQCLDDNRYLAYLFFTDAWRAQIREKVTAVKVYTVSQKILKECKIILPSEEEQEKIADFLDKKCSQIDDLIADKQKQIEKMEQYKKSLIYEYVTGKKRVKGAEI